MAGFFDEVKEAGSLSKEELSKLKAKLSRKYKLPKIPSDSEIFLNTGNRITTKPVRTLSGVAPVALMTAPFPCPHGRCLYCPGGVKSVFGDVPQSYTGKEPSTRRGMRNLYDSYLIVFNRLEQFVAIGHVPEKVELIIQGGTFPALPLDYQTDFVTYALKGLNDFGDKFFGRFDDFRSFFELPGMLGSEERTKRLHEKELLLKGKSSLEIEQKRNESAKIRCVALCVESRPDWCFEKHIDGMLKLGATRVEMGVQCLRDDVLDFVHRGHSVSDTVKATKLMRNSLLKIGYHMMPGLPGMSKEKDIEDFKTLFTNPDFMPDAIKIYPTAVIKGTGLYDLWKSGKYQPLSADDAAEIVLEAKKLIPKWCRVMRIQRDIPGNVIEAGPNLTNLRQSIESKSECRCIRCREPRDKIVDWSSVKLLRDDYSASGGKEIFLSFEDTKNDLLLGFCRLRIVPESHRSEIPGNSAGIRELHVYGQAVPLGESGDIQHKGLGRQLMAEAERIAKDEFSCKKMVVISGIGAREYYKDKLNYHLEGPYMIKHL